MKSSNWADGSKSRSRGWSNDMSGPAIEKRLQIVASLYKLWRVLRQAKLTNSTTVTGETANVLIHPSPPTTTIIQ
ncbi:MAG: hypothetical protein KDB03_00240 [Planctomycetales bacterium]|nr:hypothetical protein [Planctomycetales bacterium]